MGKIKVCAGCEETVEVNGESTEKKALAVPVSFCGEIRKVIENADGSSSLGLLGLPLVSGKQISLEDLVVCAQCEKRKNMRSQLPIFSCSGCSEASVVVCHMCPSTKQLEIIPNDVKRRWKCFSCYIEFGMMGIKWKCPVCFAKDSFCASCEDRNESKRYILQCTRCELKFHHFCAGIKYDNFRLMTTKDKNKWICDTCRTRKFEQIAKEIGKHVAISAALTGIALAGIPFGVGLLGFSATGVRAASLAAWCQSNFLRGFIARGSLFSILQSVGMVGLAASTKVGITGVCAALPLLRKLQM